MKAKLFTEATRVQIPAMVHLTRIGYDYFGKISEEKKKRQHDPDTNILTDIFKAQFAKLNPDHTGEAEQILISIKNELDNDDLGRVFYQRLTTISPTKLIDFENPQNNTFHFTAEFTCKNGEEEFRPDITLFINGLPLCFVEVKKPNNSGGMIAESERMNKVRFQNKKFRRFINITQLMIFSNNMEYDTEGGIVPIQGAFYCTAAKKSAAFNCFREEQAADEPIATFHQNYQYKEVNPEVERQILKDFNCQVLHSAPEYQTNLNAYTPTNRILTSMCSPERLLFLLKYGIAYVKMEKEVDGKIESTDEKHIMRYQQLFAALAIREKIANGAKSGVVWHTQGSGKTALSFYLTHILSDFYSKQNIVPKFYFIVDRIDLLEQALQEFEARGLIVSTANSRDELMAQFRTQQAQENSSGQAEITVVNIQKFKEDTKKITLPAYATNLQRIFIIDEAHRGYKPGGSFLANLFDADENSIKIALTGTPLLNEERASTKIFSQYFHTYYYDRSIADGYTLRIIREDIETSYREKISEIYDKLDVLVRKNEIQKSEIIGHENYVNALAEYIENDLRKFRKQHNDNTLGGMVICETGKQAEQLFKFFNEKWQHYLQKTQLLPQSATETPYPIAAETNQPAIHDKPLRAGLILFDFGDKEMRRQIIKEFKKNMTIDLLIVLDMLLTGFDAPRLKRLYFGRKIKDHSLLQAITRVNRPYKDNQYGYLIDFADIKENFEQTNAAYLQELNRYNHLDEIPGLEKPFANVIVAPEELIAQIDEVKQVLFDYTTDNLEDFSNELSEVTDKKVLLNLKKALTLARDGANIVRTFGDQTLKETFEQEGIEHLPELLSEVQRRINIINLLDSVHNNENRIALLNEIMENIKFKFWVRHKEELKIVSPEQFIEKIQRTATAFKNNIDPEERKYVELYNLFELIIQRLHEHNMVIDCVETFDEITKKLDHIIKELNTINHKNQTLAKKYHGDVKFARVHKRIREEIQKREQKKTHPKIKLQETKLVNILNVVKENIDGEIYNRNTILKNSAYFEDTVLKLLSVELQNHHIDIEYDDKVFIQRRISEQYLQQYNDNSAA